MTKTAGALPLTARPLTSEAFKPFGDVIEVQDRSFFHINGGAARRYHDLAGVQLLGPDSRAIISIVRSRPCATPLTVSRLERHPLGSQAFVPLHGQRFLVVVARNAATARTEDVHAFVTDGRQGANYHAGVWHAVLSPMGRDSDFLVVDRDGAGENCEEIDLDQAIEVRPAAG